VLASYSSCDDWNDESGIILIIITIISLKFVFVLIAMPYMNC